MADTLRLATFNLENLGHRGAGQASLEARAEVLRPQLERLAADLICLQEVDGQWSDACDLNHSTDERRNDEMFREETGSWRPRFVGPITFPMGGSTDDSS